MDETQFRLLRQRPLSLSHAAVQQQARAQEGGTGLERGGGAKGKRGGGGPRNQTFRAANVGDACMQACILSCMCEEMIFCRLGSPTPRVRIHQN
jgi:hypothetical protein